MIDLEDLQNLHICRKCKHVYMPEFRPGMDFERTPHAVNTEYCMDCETEE